MAVGIRLHFKVGEILFRSLLKVVMFVNNGGLGVALRGRTENEPQPIRQAHKTAYYSCHESHSLP